MQSRAGTRYALLALLALPSSLTTACTKPAPVVPPLELRPGQAFIAGVLTDRTGWREKVVALIFAPPSIVPDEWQVVGRATVVIGNTRPGRVLLTVGRDRGRRYPITRIVAGVPIEIPGPGCYWFGGIEVSFTPGARYPVLAHFEVEPSEPLGRLAERAPALGACLGAAVTIVPDVGDPLEGVVMR